MIECPSELALRPMKATCFHLESTSKDMLMWYPTDKKIIIIAVPSWMYYYCCSSMSLILKSNGTITTATATVG